MVAIGAAGFFMTSGFVVAEEDGDTPSARPRPELMGNRFLTLATVIRVRQIEVTRDTAHGPDEPGRGRSALISINVCRWSLLARSFLLRQTPPW